MTVQGAIDTSRRLKTHTTNTSVQIIAQDIQCKENENREIKNITTYLELDSLLRRALRPPLFSCSALKPETYTTQNRAQRQQKPRLFEVINHDRRRVTALQLTSGVPDFATRFRRGKRLGHPAP